TEVADGAGIEADAALRIAAALERDSGHPIAAAFAGVAHAPGASEVHAVAGRGIEGRVEGRHWRLGHAGCATGGHDDGWIWLGDGERAAARFHLAENARPDAGAAVAALRGQGLDVHLSSGDAADPVRRFGERFGTDAVQALQAPEDKLDRKSTRL